MSPSGGGYLLSHFRSTIGVVRLNFSVRNGKRWNPHAITTLFSFSADRGGSCRRSAVMSREHRPGTPDSPVRSGARERRQSTRARKSFRVISTARVRTSPPVRLPPINVVVCDDPQGDLILWLASCLDAFSTYPNPTPLPGSAPGGTTGVREVGPTRSSRTSVRTTQISSAHNR